MLERDHSMDRAQVIDHLQRNKFNNMTTTYYLLLKKKQRETGRDYLFE